MNHDIPEFSMVRLSKESEYFNQAPYLTGYLTYRKEHGSGYYYSVKFSDGYSNMYRDCDLEVVPPACSCTVNWLDSTKGLKKDVDYRMGIGLCKECGAFKWSYTSVKGLELYDSILKTNAPDQPKPSYKNPVFVDARTVTIGNQRYRVHCSCDSDWDHMLAHAQHTVDYQLLYGKQCGECHLTYWICISPHGVNEQVKIEQGKVPVRHCGCDTDIGHVYASINEYSDVAEHEEQCPVCGYFYFHYATKAGYKHHKPKGVDQ